MALVARPARVFPGAVPRRADRANNFPDRPENSPQLRVAVLNLLHSNGKGQQRTLEVVRELEPDLIWFAEYTPTWQRFLAARLPDFPYRKEQPSEGSFGAALFSRHPLPLAEMIQLPSGPIGFLGIHPPPPGFSARRSEERNRGLRAIPLALENLPERRIVCGDFNATPWNHGFQVLRETTGLSPGTTTSWLPTWPASLPAPLRIPIDHILVGGKLAVSEARLGGFCDSDHLPLFAVIKIVE